MKYFITVTDTSDRTRLKFKKLPTVEKMVLQMDLLSRLADSCGARVHKCKGSLISLRNKGKTRKCILTDKVHSSNNCFFVVSESCIFFGCHGCPGSKKLVHTFSEKQEFQHYENYRKLLAIHKQSPDDFSRDMIEKFILQSVVFIDNPKDPHFITSSAVPVHGFQNKLFGKEYNASKTLFFRMSDIHLQTGEDVLKFSEVLGDLTRQRKIRCYNKTMWMPFAKNSKYQPSVSATTLNLFEGYALENTNVTKTMIRIDVTKTKIWELLERNLTNYDKACHEYLLNFLSHKIQKSWVKIPVCQLFVNSTPGAGKSSFSIFLRNLCLFLVSSQTMLSLR